MFPETVIPKLGKKLFLSVLAQDRGEVLKKVGADEAHLEVIEEPESSLHQRFPFADGQVALQAVATGQIGTEFFDGFVTFLFNLK